MVFYINVKTYLECRLPSVSRTALFQLSYNMITSDLNLLSCQGQGTALLSLTRSSNGKAWGRPWILDIDPAWGK
jgi:hypothetical protein